MYRTHLFSLLLGFCSFLIAQPEPGDLFKEYRWYNEAGDCLGALRVGGRLDYRVTEQLIDYLGKGLIQPPFDVDLRNAIGAELVVEKLLCHGDTEGLRVSINGKSPLRLPEAQQIPRPQSAYAHHLNVNVPVNLDDLYEGDRNTFMFEVDTAGHWWPQNLVYGMILRIYYDPAISPERGRITKPADGAVLGMENQVRIDLPEDQPAVKIDLIAYYDGPDLEGDGSYRKWHYAYHKCQIYNHIASIIDQPYMYNWNTEWIPDQEEFMQLAAFVHQSDGYMYMTEAVDRLKLERSAYSVELCKPYRRPKGWFTRNGEFSERFQIRGNPEGAAEAKMVFRTWSPGYFNGIYINDFLVFTREGPKYAYFQHDSPPEELHVLKQGENILKTGLTPLYPEGMVHGVEVQWPGIMLLIKYKSN